jgi:hypothetical protein
MAMDLTPRRALSRPALRRSSPTFGDNRTNDQERKSKELDRVVEPSLLVSGGPRFGATQKHKSTSPIATTECEPTQRR